MHKLRAWRLFCFFILPFFPALANELPANWTPSGKIPEKYSRLIVCAERGNAICQFWTGSLWVGEDFLSGPFTEPSEIFNPLEARPWLHAAALQKHKRAMRTYGLLLCDKPFQEARPTENEIIEGIAWMIGANGFQLIGLDTDDVLFCPHFTKAVSSGQIDREIAFRKAAQRAIELKQEIDAASGIKSWSFDPCTPFSWIDKLYPDLELFKICLRSE